MTADIPLEKGSLESKLPPTEKKLKKLFLVNALVLFLPLLFLVGFFYKDYMVFKKDSSIRTNYPTDFFAFLNYSFIPRQENLKPNYSLILFTILLVVLEILFIVNIVKIYLKMKKIKYYKELLQKKIELT